MEWFKGLSTKVEEGRAQGLSDSDVLQKEVSDQIGLSQWAAGWEEKAENGTPLNRPAASYERAMGGAKLFLTVYGGLKTVQGTATALKPGSAFKSAKGTATAHVDDAAKAAPKAPAKPNGVDNKPPATENSPRGVADGSVRFKKWRRGEPIDKPLPDGSAPTWETVQSRYWKNRYEASKGSREFTKSQLSEMRKGNAPMDYNPRTGQWERRELHHVDPQRHTVDNGPLNLRELTPDWHAEVDPFRHVPGITPNRGIR